jgi:AcrR family transcriptional regulator
MRRRIIASGTALTERLGWSAVTMDRLAQDVGVSRQTVYNEIGSRSALGEAMVLSELSGFLAIVERAFDRNPTDPTAAIRSATEAVLRHAQDHALLRSIVSGAHGAESELLPYLTTHSDSVLVAATSVVSVRLTPLTPQLSGCEREATVDMVVRTVLSHVMRPSGSVDATAEGIAKIIDRVLGWRVA